MGIGSEKLPSMCTQAATALTSRAEQCRSVRPRTRCAAKATTESSREDARATTASESPSASLRWGGEWRALTCKVVTNICGAARGRTVQQLTAACGTFLAVADVVKRRGRGMARSNDDAVAEVGRAVTRQNSESRRPRPLATMQPVGSGAG
jgi:hypothetical protein